MKDWLSMIFWGASLVVFSILCAVGILLFIAAIMATLAIPIVLIIWAIGALL